MFEMRVDPEEKQLMAFYGQPVCLIMKDGSRKVGLLTACRSGRVILNGSDEAVADATVSRKKATRRNTRSRARKPKESPVAHRPHVQAGEDDDFQIGPIGGLGPDYSALPAENVPLHSVDSVLVL